MYVVKCVYHLSEVARSAKGESSIEHAQWPSCLSAERSSLVIGHRLESAIFFFSNFTDCTSAADAHSEIRHRSQNLKFNFISFRAVGSV